MKKSKFFLNCVLVFSISISVFLTSCEVGSNSKTVELSGGYISIEYPKECTVEDNGGESDNTTSFILDDKNFVIVAEEPIEGINEDSLDANLLKETICTYSEPVVSTGFEVESDEEINMGNNQGYKIVYNDGSFSIGYIFWFEKDVEPKKLYKMMFVHDNENKNTILDMIDSVELSL